ncbi:uncharacterized protein LOC112082931 [Eutrema salsugineum]|uniref:uncharacterized protein LOC112082931 n=1 Tax=Eutrema salsugineum TaxID=72664 RepID=UPI000CECF9F6|nr:uncharacterized protein LOC112082931 [Eutrema salsugineum]
MTLHLLFHCPFASEVWKTSPFAYEFDEGLIQDVAEGLNLARESYTLSPIGLDKGLLFLWICWTLWISGNQKIFNYQSFSEAEVVLKAVLDAREWLDAQSITQPAKLITDPETPPQIQLVPEGFITCCTDATWTPQSEVAGLGWISPEASILNRNTLHHS